jgi:SAM-dependent methyltransferase
VNARCLACGATQLTEVADLGDTPVLIGALTDSAEDARRMARGPMHLSVCRGCGHVQNTAFDPALIDYDASYDNSLYFSGTFREYAEALVARLVERYDLHGRTVLEVGAGAGDFLVALCLAGNNKGIGFDPSAPTAEPAPGVELVQDYFRPSEHSVDADLLVCRHVLEHLDDPLPFLRAMADSARRDAAFYLEVPSAEYNFGPEGQWDCIYPHVSYFSADSLRTLVERSGLEVVDEGFSFGGQFLYVEARPAAETASPVVADSVARHVALVETFAERWTATIDRWRQHVAAADRPVVLWGAGAKGVTFLNAVDPGASLTVVDLNPRKWRRYLPCAGHEVTDPAELKGQDVDSVLVTNAIYQDEIARLLDQLGVRAPIMIV